MLNREIKLDIVKKNKEETTASEVAFETKAIFVSKLVEENVQKIMTGIFAYVLLDTVRKVAIAIASKSSQK